MGKMAFIRTESYMVYTSTILKPLAFRNSNYDNNLLQGKHVNIGNSNGKTFSEIHNKITMITSKQENDNSSHSTQVVICH